MFTECPSERCARNPSGKGHLKCTLVRGEDNPWEDRTPFFVKSLIYTLRQDVRLKQLCFLACFLVMTSFLLTLKVIPVGAGSLEESPLKLSGVGWAKGHWYRRKADRLLADGRKTEAVEQWIQALTVNPFDRESARCLLELFAEAPTVKPGWVRLGVAQSKRLLGFTDPTVADVERVSRFYQRANLVRMAYTGDRRLVGPLSGAGTEQMTGPTPNAGQLIKAIKSQFNEGTSELPVEMGIQLYREFFESGSRDRFEHLWARRLPGLNDRPEARLYRWGWDSMSRDRRGSDAEFQELQAAALNPSSTGSAEANRVLVRVFCSLQKIPEAGAALQRLVSTGQDAMSDHLLLVRSLVQHKGVGELERAAEIFGSIVTPPQTVSEAILQLEACHDLGRDEHLMELLDADLSDFNYSPALCLAGAQLLHASGMASELANLGVSFREYGGADKGVREFGFFATGLAEVLRGNRNGAAQSLERFVSSGALDPAFVPQVAAQLKSLGFARLAASLVEPSVFPQDSGTQTAATTDLEIRR